VSAGTQRLFHQVRTADPRVRALPYPYRGALAISSDVEFFRFDVFEELMTYLNTGRDTALGVGLGLEVTSSVFFYSAPGTTFAYFRGAETGSGGSAEAERIADYIRSGWIDTNHSFGDFDPHHRFRREHALEVYAELDRLGASLDVYTDHGGPDNLQNVGPGSPQFHFGDVPGTPYYHADLLASNGVDWVWSDAGMWTERPPPEVEQQARPPEVTGRWRRLRQRLRGRAPSDAGGIRRDWWAAPPQDFEELIGPFTLQDGSVLRRFVRMRSTGRAAPNFASLGFQLSQIDWAEFYDVSGVVVVYQHLGVLHRVSGACVPTSLGALRERPEVYLAPLRFLARESGEGRLWVAGVERLLRFVRAAGTTRVTAAGGVYSLAYDGVVRDPEWFFAGLTLYIDDLREFRTVEFAGRKLPVVHNGPDESRRYSVTVPLPRLPDLW
jgi:hypothetical protein